MNDSLHAAPAAPSPPPSDRPRRFRAAGWAGGVLGLLVLGVVAGEASGWPMLRQPLQDAMTRGAGVPVQLDGGVKVHLLWRPRVEVGHLRVASDERFKAPHLLDAQRVLLAWTWGDVWRWRGGERLRVQTLRAGELDAHLVRLADGGANWQLGAPAVPDPDAPGALDSLPRFGSLVMDQGRITLNDAVQDVVLKVAVRGREGEALQGAEAGYVATFDGRYQALPLQLEVQAGGTLPLLHDDAAAAPWVPVRVEGSVGSSRLLYDGQAAALLGAPRLQGKLHFRGRSLAAVGEPLGITLPRTPPFDLRGVLEHNAGAWRLQASSAVIGSSRLAGDLLFDRRVQPAKLSGRLTGSKLAFADLGPAIGASGATPTEPETSAPGRVLPQRRFDLPSLKAMDADVQVNIDEVDFGTAAMAPLKRLQTRVHLSAGVLRLDALQAVVSGGSIQGSTRLDANANPAAWAAELAFNGIDLAGWLPGLRAQEAPAQQPAAQGAATLKRERQQARQGGDQPVQAYLTGELFGRVNVRGAGRSTAEILGSLDGPVQLTLRDGTLSHLATEAMGLDVAQALGVLIQGDHPLPLRCARFDLVSRAGLVVPTLAVIDNRDSTIRIAGEVNLRDESLALRVVTRPKDWSPLSLRTPVTVTGTLGKPDLGIEGKGLVGRVLGSIALGAVAGPAAALLPLIEPGSSNETDPCTVAAAPAQTPAKAPAKPAVPATRQKP